MRQDILHSGRMKPRHQGMLESDPPMKKAPEPKFAGLLSEWHLHARTW